MTRRRRTPKNRQSNNIKIKLYIISIKKISFSSRYSNIGDEEYYYYGSADDAADGSSNNINDYWNSNSDSKDNGRPMVSSKLFDISIILPWYMSALGICM